MVFKIVFMCCGNILPHHGQVDVAGGELHVDLLVDHGLGGGVKVLADLGHGDFTCGALARLGYFRLVQWVQVRACATAAGPIGSTLAVAMQTIRRLLGNVRRRPVLCSLLIIGRGDQYLLVLRQYVLLANS